MNHNQRRQLKIEAVEWMQSWAINWGCYHPPVVCRDSGTGIQASRCMGALMSFPSGELSVVWRPRSKKHGSIILTSVWIDDAGHITQAGSNYGDLVT